MIALLIIGLSTLTIVGMYLHACRIERSYLNVLTPTVALFVPIYGLAELIYVLIFGPSASAYAYLLAYTSYLAFFLGLTYTYSMVAARSFSISGTSLYCSRSTPYFLLAAAIAVYWPVLSAFRDLVWTPREIYEQTRSGYGVYFFISTALCNMAIVAMLSRKYVSLIEFSTFFCACLFFLWLHGSKGHMLTAFVVLSLNWVYGKNNKLAFRGLVILTSVTLSLAAGAFYLTSFSLIQNLGLIGIVQYADYNRNGMEIIDSGIGPYWGRLVMENELYSRIPRLLYPSKPDDFGEFFLAKRFTPDAFYRGAGAPSFGYGIFFADFNILAPVILFLTGCIKGFLLKSFVAGYKVKRTPGGLILLLYGAGVSMIPLSGINLLFESLIIGIMMNFCSRAERREGADNNTRSGSSESLAT